MSPLERSVRALVVVEVFPFDQLLIEIDITRSGFFEAVGDKGYPSNQSLVDLEAVGVRACLSEPDRGRRNWRRKSVERPAVYRNRRRIRGARGKRLLRRRGERLERPFAYLYETGCMRRMHPAGTATSSNASSLT